MSGNVLFCYFAFMIKFRVINNAFEINYAVSKVNVFIIYVEMMSKLLLMQQTTFLSHYLAQTHRKMCIVL